MQGYGKRVLIIDDADDLRYLTSMALSNAGYNTYSASDGAEGLAAMTKRRYDVVLVDYHMPRVNGLQFIEMSRAKWPDIPIILMSGDHRFYGQKHLLEGTFACVEKPFELPHLIELVGCACRRTPQLVSAQTPAFSYVGSVPL
jgi:two-component system chemotaxis response regulator CheY